MTFEPPCSRSGNLTLGPLSIRSLEFERKAALVNNEQTPEETHVVGAVEVFTLRVGSGASVITADDEGGGAVVLADDRVPDRLYSTVCIKN